MTSTTTHHDPEPIGLLGLGAHVPERVLSNAEWASRLETTDAWIVSRTGIRQRHVADDDDTTATLAVAAARVALVDAGLTSTDLDEIIIATDTPEVYIPDTASYVQDLLGAREIPAYDLAGSGCAGFLQAIDIARSRVADSDRCVLVVGAELLTRLMNWSDRNTCVLFGDAAGAAVVGRRADAIEILAQTAGTDGSHAGILTLEAGGTRRPFTLESAQRGEHQRIVMHGRKVFREAVRRMTAASRQVLRQAGVEIEDVSWVVPHQANLRIIQAVGSTLGIPEEKIVVNIERYGNTGSASVPLALWEASRAGRILSGDLVLLTSFGAGFHWAALLLRF